jgi:hypothetical protein
MDIRRIRVEIAEISSRQKNVRFCEIESLLGNHVRNFLKNYKHRANGTHHVFSLNSLTLSIAEPHGGGFIKRPYVRKFLEAMEELDFYRPGEMQ